MIIAAKDGNCPELSQPDNDGSNACAFLSVQIADEIHRLHQVGKGNNNGVWTKICDASEWVIMELPRVINSHRQVEELYDVQSAYTLIRSIGGAIDEYEFSEEFFNRRLCLLSEIKREPDSCPFRYAVQGELQCCPLHLSSTYFHNWLHK
ncbi:hypothetical protein OS493_019415 [Desmophyllum pertusum]|uniref:Uncharacterized protein n=1 Tax=Desmophyllum pertusum TaxID=174260 RepID=A0A9X0A1S1_9CNID|nr:hypothetical protein OS493_019415 [Desmophyllum pertusum]